MNHNTKRSLGLSENVAAMLCYAFGWLGALIILILEKENKFIKFHALQSIATFFTLFIFSMIARFIPFLGWLVISLLTPFSILLWLFLLYKASQGHKYKVPFIGEWVDRQLNN